MFFISFFQRPLSFLWRKLFSGLLFLFDFFPSAFNWLNREYFLNISWKYYRDHILCSGNLITGRKSSFSVSPGLQVLTIWPLSLTASPGLCFDQQLNSQVAEGSRLPSALETDALWLFPFTLLNKSQSAVLSLRLLAAFASVIHSNKMVPLSTESPNKGCTNKKPLSWKEKGG